MTLFMEGIEAQITTLLDKLSQEGPTPETDAFTEEIHTKIAETMSAHSQMEYPTNLEDILQCSKDLSDNRKQCDFYLTTLHSLKEPSQNRLQAVKYVWEHRK